MVLITIELLPVDLVVVDACLDDVFHVVRNVAGCRFNSRGCLIEVRSVSARASLGGVANTYVVAQPPGS